MKIIQPLLPLFVYLTDEIVCENTEEIINELKTSRKISYDKFHSKYEDNILSITGSAKNLINKIKNLAISKLPQNVTLEIEEIWGQIQKENMSTAYHTHYDCNNPTRNGLAFVYYLSATEEQGVLQLVVEHGFKDYSHLIKPKTNNLILFPLNTPHFTMRNTTNKERISVSGNLIFKEKNETITTNWSKI